MRRVRAVPGRAPSAARWIARTAPLSVVAIAASALTVAAATPSSAATGDVTIAPVDVAVLVDGGRTARIGVRLDIEGGGALTEPVVVTYETGMAGDTAREGDDYRAASGRLSFAAGTASGTTTYVRVRTRRDDAAELAESFRVDLTTSTTGATVAEDALVVLNAHGLPYLDSRLSDEQRVDDLIGRMSLAEKIGQMTQAERGDVFTDPSLITQLRLGSVLSGGGSTPPDNTPQGWADMIDRFQTAALANRLQIPLLYGIDAVHGNGNLKSATIFPHNVGLGSTRNPALVERVYRVTAEETRAIGVPWNFAPCLCVARDERWGRAYEAFGEVPSLVTAMETSIRGLQGSRPSQLDDPGRVLATIKHFAGDGDTEYGTGPGDYQIDQGVAVTDRRDFWRTDLQPYVPAVQRYDAGSLMPSFSSIDWVEDGVGNPIKMHDNEELITGWLKGKQDFDGFVITDWLGIHQISGDPGALDVEDVRRGVNAGSDMFMEPGFAADFQAKLTELVRSGEVRNSRINDAVRRILLKKLQLGLFEKPFADRRNADEIYSAEHRAVARRAAAESQVLLKNEGDVLPLARTAKVYVAGRNADDLGNQMGGWTIQWQGVSGNDDREGTTILEGIREVAPEAEVTYSKDASAPTDGSDVGVVVVGETAYAEGFGDVGAPSWPWGEEAQKEPKEMTLTAEDKAAVDTVCDAMPCVVLVVSGRTQVVSDQIDEIDGLVASWLPGSEGQGVADVIFGNRPFTGQLSKTWPRSAAQEPINVGDAAYDPQFPFGWGLRTDDGRTRLRQATVGLPSDGAVGRALDDVSDALRPAYWNSDGTVRSPWEVTSQLEDALRALERADVDATRLERAIVSVARDVAQRAVIDGTADGDAMTLIAKADVALLAGDPATAFSKLKAVWT